MNQSINEIFVGKVCMFRTYSAGVHFGELAKKEDQSCLIKKCRRVWKWDGACSLSQLAKEGSKKKEGCKIAVELEQQIIEQVIEIIPMTKEAINNLYGIEAWKI